MKKRLKAAKIFHFLNSLQNFIESNFCRKPGPQQCLTSADVRCGSMDFWTSIAHVLITEWEKKISTCFIPKLNKIESSFSCKFWRKKVLIHSIALVVSLLVKKINVKYRSVKLRIESWQTPIFVNFFFFTHRAVVKARKAFFSERWEATKAEENPKVCTSWGPSGVRNHVQVWGSLYRHESARKNLPETLTAKLRPSWTASRAPQESRIWFDHCRQ